MSVDSGQTWNGRLHTKHGGGDRWVVGVLPAGLDDNGLAGLRANGLAWLGGDAPPAVAPQIGAWVCGGRRVGLPDESSSTGAVFRSRPNGS
jgi:hypothetical protein